MPDWREQIRSRLSGLSLEPVREAEIVEELAQHLEDRYLELINAGSSEPDAFALALSEISDADTLARRLKPVEKRAAPEPIQPGAIVSKKTNWIRDFVADMAYAFRAMRRQPAFTGLIVLTLALGIGPLTAIFTVAHAVLVKPLPYKEPDRLVRLWKTTQGGQRYLSLPDFSDVRDGNRVFEALGSYGIYNVFNLTGEGRPEAIQTSVVSGDMLAALGVPPAMGRWFLSDEDKPGAARVAVLSDALWRQRFGSDPNIIGRSLTFNSQPHTVVGVMPAGFEFPINPGGTRLWANDVLDPNDPDNSRNSGFANVVARLKPGVSAEQARAELELLLQPHHADEIRVDIVPVHQQVVGDVQSPLQVLFGAISFVLLIACANVANLLLVRSAARQKEVAVRMALGASQSRLFRQLLTESLLLATIGGVVGLLLASVSLDLLVSLSPIRIPRAGAIAIDGWVFAFLTYVVVVIGALFGTLSAFRLSEGDLREALKEGMNRSSSGRRRQRLRSGLIVAEIALSLVLLLGAGLLLRSLLRLQAVDPGLNTQGVLCINMVLPQAKYSAAGPRADFIRQSIERLQSLPGVRAVGSAAYHPWTMAVLTPRIAVEGQSLPDDDDAPTANCSAVSPDYFSALNIPLLEGRAFTTSDITGAPGVAIVNQTFARTFFGGENAIGRRVLAYQTRDQQKQQWLEVVGVAGDIRQAGVFEPARPELHVPHAQNLFLFMTFFVRTEADPVSLADAAKDAILQVDKDQPAAWVTTLDQIRSGSMADRRGMMFLLAVFAGVALLLAAVGIYGVISNSVSQRTHEIGIRMALGAQVTDVLRLVLRQGMLLVLFGVFAGLLGASLLTRVIASMLFEISPTDPITFAAISMLVTVVAVSACYFPARRASRVEPIVALRQE